MLSEYIDIIYVFIVDVWLPTRTDWIKDVQVSKGNPAGEPLEGHVYIDCLEGEFSVYDEPEITATFVMPIGRGNPEAIVIADSIIQKARERKSGVGAQKIKYEKYDGGENFPIILQFGFCFQIPQTQRN